MLNFAVFYVLFVRLIMAFESNKEAIEWKAAIEQQIRVVGESRRPMLPDSVDAKTISAILDLSSSGYVWKRVAVYEGVCVLEHITFERWSNRHYKYHPMMNFQVSCTFRECILLQVYVCGCFMRELRQTNENVRIFCVFFFMFLVSCCLLTLFHHCT